MRYAIRSVGVFLVAMLGVVVLAIGSAFTAALAFGATALIVPGTGTPDGNIVENYLKNATDRYITPFDPACGASCDLKGINYPASFFPLAFIPGWCRSGPDGCDKWDDSVGQGTAGLAKALTPFLDLESKEDVTIFGYSQGGAVVSNVLQYLGGLDQSVKDRLHVVTIGGIENPDGGLWSRLGFLPTIPFLDITFGPPMTTNTGIDTTAIGLQYDPVTYAPRYFGNPLALLNALAALETVHGYYLSPNGNGPTDTLPYGYTTATLADQLNCGKNPGNCRYGLTPGTKNTYIMIPATSLPIFDLIAGALPDALKPLVQPIINLLTPVTKVLVDLGYDFSGDPDVPTPLSILPFSPSTNLVKVAADLVAAVIQGVHDAFGGGAPGLAPAATTPLTAAVNTPVTTLAERSIAPKTSVASVPEAAGVPSPVTSLAAPQKSPVADNATELATGTTPTSTDVPAATSKDTATPAAAKDKPNKAAKDDSDKDDSTGAESTKDEPKKAEPAKNEPKSDTSDSAANKGSAADTKDSSGAGEQKAA